jgi:hypothetical protein
VFTIIFAGYELVLVQDNMSWGWVFGIPAIAMAKEAAS